MAKKNSFTGEILHCGSVRYQLNGSGIFQSQLFSTDDSISSDLPDITMSVVTSRSPTILSNFQQDRMFLRGKTTEINEVFNISRIILYIRPVATGYPTA